jgi:transcription antitermination factor NusG
MKRKGKDEVDETWCILRVRGSRTLRLAQSLAEDGYDVWTPTETRKVRIPKVNVRRDIVSALMPSYVFARTRHLVDLLQLAALPVKPRRGKGLRQPAHDDFTVMRAFGGIPTVSDSDLAALRALEAKRTPRRRAERSFDKGAGVKVEGGSFGGLAGVVERSDRTHTMVCFDGRLRVKIPTCILREDGYKA